MVEQAMRKSEVLALLREHKPVLAERFGVGDLALFGSIVRDEAGPDSDVDILVTLPNARGWSGYGEVLQYLVGLFGRSVDLVVETEVRGELPSLDRSRGGACLRVRVALACSREGSPVYNHRALSGHRRETGDRHEHQAVHGLRTRRALLDAKARH